MNGPRSREPCSYYTPWHDATKGRARGRGPRAPQPLERVPGACGARHRRRRDSPRQADRPALRRRSRRPARGARAPRTRAPAREATSGAARTGRGPWLGVRPRSRAAALTLYLDTSALVKLVVVEDGSDVVAELWGTSARVAASILSYPEGRAALAAARRRRRLTRAAHARALAHFEEVQRELLVVGIHQPTARHARHLPAHLRLRGYD